MNSQKYIVSVFANDGKKSLEVEKEFNQLASYMGDWNKDDPFMCFHPLPVTISENLQTKLDQLGKKISIFHFSGHANEKRIDLQTLDESGVSSFTKQQLSVYLSPEYCPNLKVVFLNACNTKELADELIAKGVPIVIATNGLVSDKTALKVSSEFFRCLKTGKVNPLSMILANFRKSLESIAKTRSNPSRDIFSFWEEEEEDSEWFINYGGNTEPMGTLPENVQQALKWIPYEVKATDSLPSDGVKIIKENLKLFDFTDQRNPINGRLHGQKIGFFHLHGEPDRGLSWISKDLQGQYFDQKPDLLSIELQIDHLDAQADPEEELPPGIEKLIDDIWKKAAETFGSSNQTDAQSLSKVEQLAELFFKQIQLTDNRDIALKITDPGISDINLLQTVSPALSNHLIQPLNRILTQKIGAIQPLSRQIYLKKILVLLVTESQLDRTVLPDLFGCPIIQVLPPIKKMISTEDLQLWRDNLQFFNHKAMEPLLNQWDKIPTNARPMFVMERVCELLGYELTYRGGSRKEYRIQKSNF